MAERRRLCKVLRRHEAAQLLHDGAFRGSADDMRDGFVHLSTEAQLSGTLAKHFANEHDVFVAYVLIPDDDPDLRYEGDGPHGPYPHLYRPLPLSAVTALARPSAEPDNAQAASE